MLPGKGGGFLSRYWDRKIETCALRGKLRFKAEYYFVFCAFELVKKVDAAT